MLLNSSEAGKLRSVPRITATIAIAMLGLACSSYDPNELFGPEDNPGPGAGSGGASVPLGGTTNGGRAESGSSAGGTTALGGSSGGGASGQDTAGAETAGSTQGGTSSAGKAGSDGGKVTSEGGSNSTEAGAPPTGSEAGSGGNATCTPTGTELCDGLDNDCNAEIDEGKSCPANCTGQALNGKGYMFCDVERSFSSASTACGNADMRLVWIESAAENTAILNAAESLGFVSERIWLGGTDRDSEGEWQWV
ncbi:MAG TPA: C-type lectin domain-containing protein, partial [Polyangiaceae bacterium]